jgi:hypothetical protein
MNKTTSLPLFVRRAFLVLSIVLMSGFSMKSMAQTDISTEQGLRDIATNTAGSYSLTADITVTATWTPISGFSGTLNGNGHVIKGLTFNNTGTNSVGLFASTSAGATITKLGIENANLVGNADVGGIVGVAVGTTISECYVANSYIEGRDHVGGITGALKSTSLLQNSYATAIVASRSYQAGGLTGILLDGSIKKCYFSGQVYTVSGGSNVGGLAPLIDGGTVNVIENSVVLSPYIIGGTVCRILANANGKPNTLTNNYALDALLKGGNLTSLAVIAPADVNVGTDKIHGANVTKADALTAVFYSTTLGWDLTNTWTMLGEGQIYPTLKWQVSPVTPSILGISTSKKSIALNATYAAIPFGSMGQAVSISHPATTFFTSATVDNKITYTGVLAGTETVTAVSASQTYLAAASLSFNLEVYDPAVEIQITTPADLINIKSNPARKYILMNDIDVSSIAAWSPIPGFSGSLNGNGHIIKGLTFNSTSNTIGLFSTTLSGAIITKLGIENARFVGNSDVSGFVGNANNTTITECYVTNSYIEGSDHVGAFVGNLNSGSVIRNCYSTANVVSRSSQAGGFVGVDNNATIDKCFFSGLVTTNNSNTGGFISLLEGATTITNSVCLSPYIVGGAIGRIVGSFNGQSPVLTNNYGLDEFLKGNNLVSMAVLPSDDANLAADKLHGANVTKANAQTSAFYSTTLGWDMTSVWTVAEEGKIYPMLKWQTKPVATTILGVSTDKKTVSVGNSTTVKGYGSLGQAVSFTIPANTIFTSTAAGLGYTFTGTTAGQETVTITSPANAYLAQADLSFILEVFDPNATLEITTVADLVNIKNNPARNYILKNNLDLSSIADWAPIGTNAAPFTGGFDGAGYTISNLKINQSGSSSLGLFGVTTNAIIKKVALTQVDVIGSSDTGGLIGKASGTVVSQVSVTGKIEGNDHVGALIGGTTGGTLTTLTNSYANAAVSTRSSQAGGLAGAVSSLTMTNCYFAGTVTAPTTGWTNNSGGLVSITEDASVSLVNSISAATSVIGGTTHPFAARNAVTITNCFYRADMVIDPLTIGVNAGTVLDATLSKPLSELQLQSTYSALNWDFTTIWKINSNEFPTLIGVGVITDVPALGTIAKTINAYTVEGALHLNGVKDSSVKVYTVSGVLVAQLQSVVTDAAIKLPSKGVYLVSIVAANNVISTLKVINN